MSFLDFLEIESAIGISALILHEIIVKSAENSQLYTKLRYEWRNNTAKLTKEQFEQVTNKITTLEG